MNNEGPKQDTNNFQQSQNPNGKMSVFNPTLTELDNLRDYKNEKNNEKAQKKIDTMKIKRLNSDNELENYKLCVHVDEFQNFGEGLFFYFYFLKFFGFVFLIISLLVVAPLVLNTLGNGLGFVSQTDVFVATTLGNLSRVMYTQAEIEQMENMSEEEKQAYSDEKHSTLKKLFIFYMVLDMVISVFLMASYYIFKRKVDHYSYIINKKNISVSKYTFMVFGIPEVGITEEEVAEYFSQFGTVIKVSFAYKYEDALYNMMNIAHYKSKLKSLKSKPNKVKNRQVAKRMVKRLQNEIKAVNKKIKVNKLNINNMSSFKVYCAFVTFDDTSSPSEIERKFKAAYHKTFLQKFCCQKKFIPEEYLFKDRYKLRFKTPDHPRNIYWENLEYTKFSRFLKVLVLILLAILILLFSLLINLLLTAIVSSETQQCANENITTDDIESETDSQAKAKLIYCYCASLGLSEIFNVSENREYCMDYYIRELQKLGIAFAVGITLAVINKLIDILIKRLAEFIRYSSKTKVAKERIFYAYVIQYINTAFVIYMIYSKLFGFSVVETFNSLVKSNFIEISVFLTDLNRRWYPTVGSKIITPILISIFIPHVSDLLLTLILGKLKQYKAKKATTANKYIKANMPPDFVFELKYTNILKNIFVVLTFSTGIPLLYWCLLLAIIIMYWTSKYTALRYSKLPPLYSSDLVMSVVNKIPLAIVIHMIFGIYFLGNEEVFPSTLNLSMGFDQKTEGITSIRFFQDFIDRAVRCLPYTILLCLVIITLFLENSIVLLLKGIFSKSKVHAINDNLGTYTDNYEKIRYFSLPNYNMALNPQYRKLLKLSLVNYNSIRSFTDGSSLKNIIESTNMLEDKPGEQQMDKLEASLANNGHGNLAEGPDEDSNNSGTNSVKVNNEDDDLEPEQPNPLLFELKRRGRTHSLEIFNSKRNLANKDEENNIKVHNQSHERFNNRKIIDSRGSIDPEANDNPRERGLKSKNKEEYNSEDELSIKSSKHN